MSTVHRTASSGLTDAAWAAIGCAFPGAARIELQPMVQGLSGARIFRFDAGGKSYVLRQSSHIERAEREVSCWRAAAALGLAPKLAFADTQTGVTISEFIAAEALDRSAAGIARMAHALRHLHRSHAFDGGTPLPDIFAAQVARLGLKETDTVIEALSRATAEAHAVSRQFDSAPCHLDLNPTNILQTGDRVLFIDWETAGTGDPYIDLAQLGVFVFPSPGQHGALLEAYLQSPPQPKDFSRLAVARVIALAFYALGFFLAARQRETSLALDSVTPLDWQALFPLLIDGGAQRMPEMVAATLAAEMTRTITTEAYRQDVHRLASGRQ